MIEQGVELQKVSEKKVSDIVALHARYAFDEDFQILVNGMCKVLRTGLLNGYDMDVACELAEHMVEMEGDADGR